MVNILAADKLMQSPKIYSTFLLWLLSELFEQLPEAGDVDKPKLVFFFDEAHLLFDEAPKALLEKIEQVVRLIRSKGVGVYFVSQSPLDIPDGVLAQLGNRVQHALRAFTAKDQKALRATAESFRSDGAENLVTVLGELAIGEALVSCLDAQGAPAVVRRAMIAPPLSRLAPLSSEERRRLIGASLVAGIYEESVDRESAFELLKQRAEQEEPPRPSRSGSGTPSRRREPVAVSPRGRQRQSPAEAFIMSTVRSVGSQIGRQIMRGIFGSLTGGGRR